MLRNIILTTTTSLCCLNMAVANPRIDVLYHSLEDSNAIYESRAFLPIYSNKNSIVFSDIRTVGDLEDMTELNLGVGLRQHVHSMNTILGLYYFYDQRSEQGIYRQNTIGGEVLSRYFEVRANYYMPFEEEGDNVSFTTISYQENVPHINKITKGALKGYDAEVGFVMPSKYFELGVYGSLYKFYHGDDDSNDIVGKRIRGELNVANILPYNILASIGAEYDYNDDADKRASRMSIKLGMPLSNKKYNPNNDKRMSKSIVRDLHIRVLDNNSISEKAQAKVTLGNGSEVVFDKIFYVENEEQLNTIINDTTITEKTGIVLSNNVAVLKDLELKSNHYIIGKKTNFNFVAVSDQTLTIADGIGENYTLVYNNTVKAENSSGDMVEVTTTPSDQVASASLSRIAKYFYDGVEYTELDMVNDQASLWSVLTKDGSIIVLDDDIEIANPIGVSNSALIIGKGVIEAQSEDGTNANITLLQQRTINDASNDLWESFGKHSNSKTDIIFDGVDLNLKSRIALSTNVNLKIKNSTINADHSVAHAIIDYYSTADQADSVSFENTVINKNFDATSSTAPEKGVVLGVASNLTKLALNLKDVTIKMGNNVTQAGQYIAGVPNVNIAGNLTLEHNGNLEWDKSARFDSGAKRSKITFSEGAKVVVNDKTVNQNLQYDVNETVTIGDDSQVNPLYEQSVNTDLSTLSDKIVKVESN